MEIPISSTMFHFNTEGAWNKMFLNLLELQWNTNVKKVTFVELLHLFGKGIKNGVMYHMKIEKPGLGPLRII